MIFNENSFELISNVHTDGHKTRTVLAVKSPSNISLGEIVILTHLDGTMICIESFVKSESFPVYLGASDTLIDASESISSYHDRQFIAKEQKQLAKIADFMDQQYKLLS